MTGNPVQESLLISAAALMLLQSGASSGKRVYARLDAQRVGMVLPSDPGYLPMWMHVLLTLSGYVNLAAALALLAWFVVRGPYSWWWLLPSMFIGAGLAGSFILGPFSRTGSLPFTLLCFGGVLFAVVALWVWY